MAEDKELDQFELITVEVLKALYCDKILERPYQLYRINTLSGSRIYFRFLEDGSPRYYLGTTSFSSEIKMTEQLIKWWCNMGYDNAKKYIYKRSVHGSFFHRILAEIQNDNGIDMRFQMKIYEKYLEEYRIPQNDWYSLMDEMEKDILSYLQFHFDYKLKPLAIELPLCSESDSVATLVDFVGTIDDRLVSPVTGKIYKPRNRECYGEHGANIDWKTGKGGFYASNIFQLEANRTLMQENYPNVFPVDHYYNVAPKNWRGDTPTYTISEQTNKFDLDDYDMLIHKGRKMLQRLLEREVRVINGAIKLGEDPTKRLEKKALYKIIEDNEWEQYKINYAPI